MWHMQGCKVDQDIPAPCLILQSEEKLPNNYTNVIKSYVL